MPNDFFTRGTAGEKIIFGEGNKKMFGKIAAAVLCLMCCEAQFSTGSLVAADGDQASYLAQTSSGSEKAGQRPPEAAPPPARGKAPDETGREPKPAAPSKIEPLRPFDPTEKVKADQAIDFPADI
jgi:hypothetical protein